MVYQAVTAVFSVCQHIYICHERDRDRDRDRDCVCEREKERMCM